MAGDLGPTQPGKLMISYLAAYAETQTEVADTAEKLTGRFNRVVDVGFCFVGVGYVDAGILRDKAKAISAGKTEKEVTLDPFAGESSNLNTLAKWLNDDKVLAAQFMAMAEVAGLGRVDFPRDKYNAEWLLENNFPHFVPNGCEK